MNLLLTTRCNQRCPFCFISELDKGIDMSEDELNYILSIEDISDIRSINILGGEPTVHPKFVEFTKALGEKNKNITVFSNLSSAPDILRKIDLPNIIIVANILRSLDINRNHVIENLQIIKEKHWEVILSYTITEKTIASQDIIRLCQEQGIKAVRWSLAMPSYDGDNVHAPEIPSMSIIKEISAFVDRLFANRIAAFNDCPLPKCTECDKISQLIKQKYKLPHTFVPIKTGRCYPPFDWLPNYRIQGCMGIGSRLTFDVRNFKRIADIETVYLQKLHEISMKRIIDKKCEVCVYDKECVGRCWGYDTVKTN